MIWSDTDFIIMKYSHVKQGIIFLWSEINNDFLINIQIVDNALCNGNIILENSFAQNLIFLLQLIIS